MAFTDRELELMLAATTAGDEAAREVLADALLERGHPLGELLRLEAGAGGLPRRLTLERELREPLRAALLPWALELELDRGLPAWALCMPQARALRQAEVDEGWPVPAVTVAGELREAMPLLRSPAARGLRELDLSPVWATSQYTMRVGGPPPPLEVLPALKTLALPQGEVPEHWVPVLAPGLASVQEVVVGIGANFSLPDWVLALPRLARVRLVPGREPADGAVVDTALAWSEAGPGRALEWLGETLDARGVRQALRPALPGEVVALPEEAHLRAELEPEGPSSRVFRVSGAPMVVLRTEDAPAADLVRAPRHPLLVGVKGLVRIRRGLFAELDAPGAPLGLSRLTPPAAVRLATQLLEALEAWWSTAAPDVLSGEWVGLGRDQVRRRDDGRLALVPTLTRRVGPDAHALPELAGVPLAWGRTSTMVLRLAGALLFEWLTGVPFLDSADGSALAVHRRLSLRLARPPLPSAVDPALAPFDEAVALALSGQTSLAQWRERLHLA
ncbi:MAG: hypothetical protein INH41_12395 [Myxococcaceae bacterium]|nr:hypothetical protein [Myxococcaceae bacterium]MCA3013186.1 hypothetical protein [Myxococcaceae bacterium]